MPSCCSYSMLHQAFRLQHIIRTPGQPMCHVLLCISFPLPPMVNLNLLSKPDHMSLSMMPFPASPNIPDYLALNVHGCYHCISIGNTTLQFVECFSDPPGYVLGCDGRNNVLSIFLTPGLSTVFCF